MTLPLARSGDQQSGGQKCQTRERSPAVRLAFEMSYGLQCNPFEITPNPRFLVPTTRHNEVLASIYYGLSRRKGLLVLTGEVGTGKTLLVRCLLELLHRNQTVFAYVFNTLLSPREFLQYMVRDFGLSASGKTKPELLFELNGFLIDRHAAQLATVLIVDEAQHLSPDVLEEIRLLMNLETIHQKLLQILLVGQPELDCKLDSYGLRQLKQRVAIRRRLEPLRDAETRHYIHLRLRLAGVGARPDTLFPDITVAMIHRCSRGIPRLINMLCENALIAASASRAAFVSPDLIEEVSDDLRLETPTNSGVPAESSYMDTTAVHEAAPKPSTQGRYDL